MRTAYISLVDIGSRMAHAMQVMKNAQAWSKASDDFEFLTSLSLKNYLGMNWEEMRQLYGLSQNFPIKTWPLHDRWRRFRLPGFESLYQRLAADRCAQRKVDLVYTRTYLTPQFTLARRIPTVVETHAPPDDNPEKQALYRMLDHPKLLAVVTISQELARRYEEFGLPPEKILVAPDGVDLDTFAQPLSKSEARSVLGLPKDKPIAAYVGHLYEGRGVEHIVEAALALPHVVFLLVGGHPDDLERWKKRTSDLGLKNLTFAGFVPNQMVPTYLWSADMLLMPYGHSCPTVEWMSPLKMFEYMAAGRAIVASDLPAVREVLAHGETALLCQPDNGQALSEAILQAISNPELADRLGRQALDLSASYSWDSRVHYILEFAKERLPGTPKSQLAPTNAPT
jgi:glycosyltransferase involved in cell wall biosynthesis